MAFLTKDQRLATAYRYCVETGGDGSVSNYLNIMDSYKNPDLDCGFDPRKK